MSNSTYPHELEIIPRQKPLLATVTVPGSKSTTNRALVLAALSSRRHSIRLTGALQSEDTEVMVKGLLALGYNIETSWPAILIKEHTGTELVPVSQADIFVANSGTTMRFLTALCALGKGRYRLDGIPRMRERPIGDLLKALQDCGVNAFSETGNDCPPVVIESRGITGRGAEIRGNTSSQFVSALLMVAPWNESPSLNFGIKLDGPLVSVPYIAMTEKMMLSWGATWHYDPVHRAYTFDLDSCAHYFGPDEYAIEPDASAASYFWAAAAMTGGRITVSGLTRKSLQGDVRFVDLLEQMGCRVEECAAGITVHGGKLHGIDADMNDISDTVMTLAAIACFSEGPTTIRNVAHIRHKETDRIAALTTELRKLGAIVAERTDGLTITPAPLRGCAVDTYNDHRMAMSLALIGLRVPGVIVRNPGCVAKTYPGFWEDLAAT